MPTSSTMRLLRAFAIVAFCFATTVATPVAAQSSREAERKLEKIQRELKSVADERRKIEGQRGDASRQLRAADEKVGQSNRRLREIETRLAHEQSSLQQLQQQRETLQAKMVAQRQELAQLLRGAYLQGQDAPLKLLLAQDSVAEGGRTLAYYGYLQRDRTRRIAELSTQLKELDTIEAQIVQRRSELDSTRLQQRSQLGDLQSERKERAALVASLDQRYKDRSSRERALGRDAKGLEQLLKKLRVAAARAEAQRRAAAERAAREDARRGSGETTPRKPVVVASAPAPQVGGLGWPVSGALLAGFGATMPDGRGSDGLLIAASAGAPVKAVADGTVVYAEWMTGYGLLLIVDHGNGYMSLYAHNDALLKDVGASVKRGDTVATVGNSGGQGRPALYFELRRNGAPVNPGTWLRR
ncbi:murein hydrolase activator EnvC family protein [Lysobacter sp. GCM10012299]|uniref:murein hydrolase activator EnvC family protein n=1 Tax=Lysobacter sp. GCM10012299 TaxID=3317333 RepID=UPI00361E1B13